jgi:acetate---CoA ligase (ADP-forming)
MPELMANAIRDCLPESDKPVMAYVSPHAPEVGALLTRSGVPAFAAAESCTAALAAMFKVGRFVAPVEEGTYNKPADIAINDLPSGSLDEAQAKQVFARFKVPCAAERIVTTPAEAQAAARALGGRVVLKILSSQITHKSDVGGVAIGLTPDTVGERMVGMGAEVLAKAGVRPERFLVQEMVGGGTELILGLHRDALGTAVLLGMGGVTAELFQDTTLRLLPQDAQGLQCLSRADALAMAQDLKTWPLLDGFRGRPKADVDALVDTIVAFSGMAARLGDRLVEAEINPVFVRAQGQGVSAADGVLVLA